MGITKANLDDLIIEAIVNLDRLEIAKGFINDTLEYIDFALEGSYQELNKLRALRSYIGKNEAVIGAEEVDVAETKKDAT